MLWKFPTFLTYFQEYDFKSSRKIDFFPKKSQPNSIYHVSLVETEINLHQWEGLRVNAFPFFAKLLQTLILIIWCLTEGSLFIFAYLNQGVIEM